MDGYASLTAPPPSDNIYRVVVQSRAAGVLAEEAEDDEKARHLFVRATHAVPIMTAAGGGIGGYRVGKKAGKAVAAARDRFDKELQTHKKRIANAEDELNTLKGMRKKSGDSVYDKAISKAESNVASAKSAAAPHLARSQKRADKYGKIGAVAGTPIGAAAGGIVGSVVPFMAHFTDAFGKAIDDSNNSSK